VDLGVLEDASTQGKRREDAAVRSRRHRCVPAGSPTNRLDEFSTETTLSTLMAAAIWALAALPGDFIVC
jgi:hypothetical protein